jgi:predicted small secreted protein
MFKFLSLMLVCVFITGCANTLNGMREDVAKPFVYMGKVGEKIQGKPVTENTDER